MGRKYHNYIDGHNMLDYLAGKVKISPRKDFIYVNDDGQVVAIRYDAWKVLFLENRGQAFEVWREPFVELRVPLLFNLRRDPFERAQHSSNTYNHWFLSRAFVIVPLQGLAAKFLLSMKDYPPSQTPGLFNLEKIQKQIRLRTRRNPAARRCGRNDDEDTARNHVYEPAQADRRLRRASSCSAAESSCYERLSGNPACLVVSSSSGIARCPSQQPDGDTRRSA